MHSRFVIILLCTGLLNLILCDIGFSAKRMKMAFVAGLSSSDPNKILTDKNLEKGLEVFFHLTPSAHKFIEVVKFDNHGSPRDTVGIVSQIKKQKIKFIVGISKSNEALVISKNSDAGNYIFITPFATNNEVTRNHKYVFRTCFSDARQSRVLSSFVNTELKSKKLLILRNVDSSYSNGVIRQFTAAIDKNIRVEEMSYLKHEIDYKEIKSRVKQFQPDVVFVPDYVHPSTTIINEIFKVDKSVRFLGADGWGSPSFFNKGLDSKVTAKIFYTTHWSSEIKTKENVKFLRGFKQLYPGQTPSPSIALMYDTLSVFWAALKKSKAPGDIDKFVKVLKNIKIASTTGNLEFSDPKDNTPRKKLVLTEVVGKEHKYYGLFE